MKKVIHANKKINEWTSKSKIEFEKVREQLGDQATVSKIDDILRFFEEHSQHLTDFFTELEKKGKGTLLSGHFPPKYQTIGIKDGKVIKGKLTNRL